MIASMHGPEFLVVYAVYLLLLLLFFRRQIKASAGMPSDVQGKLDLKRVDPLAIAYLQGGDIAVLKTASHRLLEKGVLQQSSKKDGNNKKLTTLILAGKAPAFTNHPVEKIIIKHLQKLRDIHTLIRDKTCLKEMAALCRTTYGESLAKQGLMYSPKAALLYPRWAYLVLLAPGLYKLLGSLQRDHFNLLVLTFVMVLLVPIAISFLLRGFRLTPEGEGYLRTLRQTVRESVPKANTASRPEAGHMDLNALIYIMIGCGFVANSQGQDIMQQVFKPIPVKDGASSSGCSGCSSCSSCSSCSGCSSCGGCGGY